jgi:hypothetical protein
MRLFVLQIGASESQFDGLKLHLSGLNHTALNKNATEVRQARHPPFIASNRFSTDSKLLQAGKR